MANKLKYAEDVAASEYKRAEKWKRLALDAMLVLRAFAVGHATQNVIEKAQKEEDG